MNEFQQEEADRLKELCDNSAEVNIQIDQLYNRLRVLQDRYNANAHDIAKLHMQIRGETEDVYEEMIEVIGRSPKEILNLERGAY